MKTNPNDSAYATSGERPYSSHDHWPKPGLTKREYFATTAPMLELVRMYYDRQCASREQCAELAVQYADALIAELNKESK